MPLEKELRSKLENTRRSGGNELAGMGRLIGNRRLIIHFVQGVLCLKPLDLGGSLCDWPGGGSSAQSATRGTGAAVIQP